MGMGKFSSIDLNILQVTFQIIGFVALSTSDEQPP